MICTLHCVLTTQSQIIFHHHIFGPLYPLLLPPFPLVTAILLCLWVFLFVFFSFLVHLLISVFYIPHMNQFIWFLIFSDFFCLVWYSRDPSMLLQMAVFQLFLGWIVFHCIYIHHIFFIQSSIIGLYGCFHVLTRVISTAMNIGVHISLRINVFKNFRQIPKRGFAGSYGNSFLKFLMNLHTVLHSGCSSLHSHEQWMRISFSPQPLQ